MNIFENPKSVMIVAKQQEPGLIIFTRELARNLLETHRCVENENTDKLVVYICHYELTYSPSLLLGM